MLKIAFCDDETQETRRLEALLEEYAADRGQDFAHTSYQSPVELMAEVEKGTRFDIILLDVLMPGENGMAAAREIREYDSNVKIIFLTSSTEFAVESYAVDAWYYQLKPIRREDFFRLMDSACAACTREQKHSLILRSKSGIVRLELEELVYCEVMGRTLTFHLNNGVVLESMGRLDDLCDQLVEYQFPPSPPLLPDQYGVYRQHRSPLHHDAGRSRSAAAPREVFGNEGPLPELYF